MEINKETWSVAYPALVAALQDERLEFVAFDLEMTGINLAGVDFGAQNRWEDSPAERVAKVAEVARRFSICQLGVALFHRAEGGGGGGGSRSRPGALEASAFNVSVYDASQDITASPSALRFLVDNGFDLKQWVLGGVPCVDEAGEAGLRSAHAAKLAAVDAKFNPSQPAASPGVGSAEGGGAGHPPPKRLRAENSSPLPSPPPSAPPSGMVLNRSADQEVAAVALRALDEWLVRHEAESHESDSSKVAAGSGSEGAAPPSAAAAPGDLGGSPAVGCRTGGCGFRVHSAPPPHFGAADRPYCCAACRKTGGKSHGGHCELKAAAASPTGEEEEACDEVVLGPFPWAGLRKFIYQELETNPK